MSCSMQILHDNEENIKLSLFGFLESTSQLFMPSPYGSRRLNGDLIATPILTDSEPQAIWLYVQSDEHRTPLRRLILEGPQRANKTACDLEITHQASVLQHHLHDALGCGDDFTCTAKLPRELVSRTEFLPSTQMIRFKRTGEYLSPFSYSLMLACPFNMAWYNLCDASRYMREHAQWTVLHEAGATKVS